uniref:PPPDE domain-containing protein n=1 Tax=Chromera velia CCMP2878 TaxID=1169474 RepID=A0A0K6S9Z6_9ALVE|eukprot:Cvel_8291.t2-p1 / transcript=Cvel_8291.t2 / gene=Cvel_8291 / organism=Chromera_velia_CCMP2878 / gene_product=hypothetical protein / transcript_product=hypothetical protein / location=Cvel_scaffold455:6691-18953(-) / protein_length=996 / sequence_SO=supercontig / SO=protein_coding / is_pseudo=false
MLSGSRKQSSDDGFVVVPAAGAGAGEAPASSSSSSASAATAASASSSSGERERERTLTSVVEDKDNPVKSPGNLVKLHVYDLDRHTKRVNHYTRDLGFDEYTGITWNEPKKHCGHIYRETIIMGETSLSEDEVLQVIEGLKAEWKESALDKADETATMLTASWSAFATMVTDGFSLRPDELADGEGFEDAEEDMEGAGEGDVDWQDTSDDTDMETGHPGYGVASRRSTGRSKEEEEAQMPPGRKLVRGFSLSAAIPGGSEDARRRSLNLNGGNDFFGHEDGRGREKKSASFGAERETASGITGMSGTGRERERAPLAGVGRASGEECQTSAATRRHQWNRARTATASKGFSSAFGFGASLGKSGYGYGRRERDRERGGGQSPGGREKSRGGVGVGAAAGKKTERGGGAADNDEASFRLEKEGDSSPDIPWPQRVSSEEKEKEPQQQQQGSNRGRRKRSRFSLSFLGGRQVERETETPTSLFGKKRPGTGGREEEGQQGMSTSPSTAVSASACASAASPASVSVRSSAAALASVAAARQAAVSVSTQQQQGKGRGRAQRGEGLQPKQVVEWVRDQKSGRLVPLSSVNNEKENGREKETKEVDSSKGKGPADVPFLFGGPEGNGDGVLQNGDGKTKQILKKKRQQEEENSQGGGGERVTVKAEDSSPSSPSLKEIFVAPLAAPLVQGAAGSLTRPPPVLLQQGHSGGGGGECGAVSQRENRNLMAQQKPGSVSVPAVSDSVGLKMDRGNHKGAAWDERVAQQQQSSPTVMTGSGKEGVFGETPSLPVSLSLGRTRLTAAPSGGPAGGGGARVLLSRGAIVGLNNPNSKLPSSSSSSSAREGKGGHSQTNTTRTVPFPSEIESPQGEEAGDDNQNNSFSLTPFSAQPLRPGASPLPLPVPLSADDTPADSLQSSRSASPHPLPSQMGMPPAQALHSKGESNREREREITGHTTTSRPLALSEPPRAASSVAGVSEPSGGSMQQQHEQHQQITAAQFQVR